MPTLSVILTEEQATRARAALRHKYAALLAEQPMTDVELAQYYIISCLGNEVLTQERSIAEDELLSQLPNSF